MVATFKMIAVPLMLGISAARAFLPAHARGGGLLSQGASSRRAVETPPAGSTQTFKGELTMWATQESGALIPAQCEFAGPPVKSMTDEVLPPYLLDGFHCAIGSSLPAFGKGENCGKCYKLTSLNDNGIFGTPGSKGSAVVMVSDGGAGGPSHFDCTLDGFKEITGADTGVFDIEFQEVECEEVTGKPVIINWADKNAWYCKMMFENIGGWGQLESVTACLADGTCLPLTQSSGATWTGCPTGETDNMTFELTQKTPSGDTSTITCLCEGSWPWPIGQRCECPANFPTSPVP
mmetsp:Transcript_99309/g.266737  ORF Transcript_99309/g.266737 Transcript_99309/m.266737 type:complete len:292 (-) Transcript_99309:65-940(-)